MVGLFWQFILLNVLSFPPRYIRTKKFDNKYGTITEDIFIKRGMYQRAYYPLFVFQRLLLTGTLIMLYSYPLYQIFIIFVLQISVSIVTITFTDDYVCDQG